MGILPPALPTIIKDMSGADIFDAALNLEDTAYAEGYAEGVADGSRAGHVEGRVFGLEKSLEKFLELGRLNARACVWSARLKQDVEARDKETSEASSCTSPDNHTTSPATLNQLPPNSRLEKHVQTLFELTDLAEISTSNDEDSVNDFDERLKRAKAKAKVIEHILREQEIRSPSAELVSDSNAARKSVRIVQGHQQEQARVESSIEDFGVNLGKGR
jgi:Essential protein Yae1, N terminal